MENMEESLKAYYWSENELPAYIVYDHSILWGSGETQKEAIENALDYAIEGTDVFLYEQVKGWAYECRGALADL